MKTITRIDGAVFRDLDRRRRQARPKRDALATGLVAQALMSRSAGSGDVPVSWGIHRSDAGSGRADAVRATAQVF
jgi:hypothetical protein